MTIPFISIPLQGHNTVGTVSSPFAIYNNGINPNLSNSCGYGISNVVTQPQGWAWSAGQPWGGSQPWGAIQGWNAGQQNLSNGAQVVAVVPVQNGNQGVISAITNQSRPLAVECAENNSELLLAFDVPGMQAEDLEVSVSGNTLHINGLRKETQEIGVLSYSEIPTGSFTRSIALPFEVTGDKTINTCLENGVLKIRLNKHNHSEKKSATSRKMRIG